LLGRMRLAIGIFAALARPHVQTAAPRGGSIALAAEDATGRTPELMSGRETELSRTVTAMEDGETALLEALEKEMRPAEVTLAYSMHPSWKQWAVQIAASLEIIKQRHPDVVVHRVIQAVDDGAPQLVQLRAGEVRDDSDVEDVVDLSAGRGGVYLPFSRISHVIQREQQRRSRSPVDDVRRRSSRGGEGGDAPRRERIGRERTGKRVFTDESATTPRG